MQRPKDKSAFDPVKNWIKGWSGWRAIEDGGVVKGKVSVVGRAGSRRAPKQRKGFVL